MEIKYSMFLSLFIVLIFSSFSYPQSFSGGFNFFLPPDDTTTQNFLPVFPVNKIKDFISINSEGHFSAGNSQIKFWGGNLVSAGAFPDTSKAGYIAGRLRKMGFNLIRFHHIDNPWGNNSLFEYQKDTRHLNPLTLQKLEYLIASLKKNGIYINMNLNVSRTFNKADGVPAADSLVEFSKGVTQFDPFLIQLQKEYAAQLLKHINPYTGLALVDDPVMAMVEIANENSLYRIWRDGNLKPLAEGGWLTYYHTAMLDSAWNKYLSDKYTSTNNIAEKWNIGVSHDGGKNQVINPGFENNFSSWRLELHEGAKADTVIDNVNPYAGNNSAKINVINVTGTDWHLQWKQVGFKLIKDSLYSIIFAARGDRNATITVSVMRDTNPYTYYSGTSFELTPAWAVYSFTFRAPENNSGYGRLTFQFTQTGNYWFDEIKLGSPVIEGLLAGESLENNNIKRIGFSDCLQYSDNRVKDMSDFYISLQKNYFNSMKEYLAKTLGVKVPIVGTNWNSGAADLSIQNTMDYIDNHSYYDHPSFPGVPWSSDDWYITNTSMAANTDAGTIPALFAGSATAGKPYTISEYNHPFPNRYQSEAPLFISAYSSFHYADAIMFFEYNSSENWDDDKVENYFSINRNNVLMSLMPSCAYAFRNNLVKPANETIELNYSNDFIKLMPKKDDGTWNFSLYPQKIALTHAIRNGSFENTDATDFSSLPAEPVNPYKTDTDEITYNTRGLLTVNTPCFAGITGFLNNFPGTAAGNMSLKSADGFGTVTWLSLTGDSLSSTGKSLITVSSKIQNTNMIWDGNTTIHNNWGSAPTQIAPLTVILKLNIKADSLKLYPLDSKGKEDKNKAVLYLPTGVNTFEVAMNQSVSKTLWYGVEKYGSGTTSVNEEDILPSDYYLGQNYPNPFNPSTNFSFRIPSSAGTTFTTLKIYDVLGKEIATVINSELSPGEYKIPYSTAVSALASGVYYYTLRSGSYSATKKMVVLK
jgi:hypothetical protein